MKIRGNTVGTPMKRPDFNQTDPKKSDFIKNNPIPQITEEDEGKVLIVEDGKFALGKQTNEKLELALNNLKAIAIGNTWILDEEKIKSKGDYFVKNFRFVSNGMSFKQMMYSFDADRNVRILNYLSCSTADDADEFVNTYYDAYYNGWENSAYMTIRTADNINLEDIATKVESTNDLITDAKTLIDAINELSRSVKFVPVTYVEPVEDEDGNVIEEGGWFAERKDEFGNFVRDVAITALVGGENKFVFYERQPLIEGGAFSPIYIDKFIDIESVDNAIDFIDQIIASTWKRLPEESQEGIIEFIDNANTQLKKNVTDIYNWIMGLSNLPQDFVDTIQNINKGTKETVDKINVWFEENTEGSRQWLKEKAAEALDLAQQALEKAGESLENALVELGNEIRDEVDEAWQGFQKDVETTINNGLESLTTGYNELKTEVEGEIKEGIENAQAWIDDTGKQVAYKLDEIVEFFGGDLVPDSTFAGITTNTYSDFAKNNSIDALNTKNKTIVGSINELNSTITGNTWRFPDTIYYEPSNYYNYNFKYNFEFISNNETFTEMECVVTPIILDGAAIAYRVEVKYTKTDGRKITVYSNSMDEWNSINPAYQTIFTYDTSITPKGAERVTTQRYDLNTTDKTVIGAINEVNESVGEAKKTLNTIKDKVVSNITELTDAGADFAEIKSYGVAWSNQSRIHYGDGEYVDIYRTTNIPLVAGENITFTPVGEDAEIIKVNAEVDTSNLDTVDKVKSIDTWYEGVSELNTDDGIYWREGFAFYDGADLTGNEIASGRIHHRIPIVAGNGVEFENDGNVITINATGGSSAEDNVVGTWVFNYDLELTGGIDAYFNFTGYDADGVEREFNRLCINAIIDDGVLQDYSVEYYNSDGDSFLVCDTMDAFWINDMSRTITINEQPTDNDFIACVKKNAKKKGAVSYVAKYVVDISGGENVVGIINKLREDYPDFKLGVWSIIEFTGATSGLYGITIDHYGGNTYNISGMNFANCYSMSNNVRDWSQVSVWGFSGYFQPPIPYCDDSNNGQVLKVVNGVPTWV